MRVRVYAWEYHTDPLRLADEVNECIKSCENLGDTVLDADVLIRPNEQAKHGMEYLVVVKFDGNRHAYLLPPVDPAEDEPEPTRSSSVG
jgi:hypothetical protein